MSTQTDVEALAKLRDDHQVWLRRAYEQGYDDAIKGVPNDAEIEERTKVRIESARAFDALLARAEPEIRRSHESTPAPAAPDALDVLAWLIEFPQGDFSVGSFGPEWLSAEGGFLHWDRDAWKSLWFASKESAEKFLAAYARADYATVQPQTGIHDKLIAIVTQHGFDAPTSPRKEGEG